MRNDSNFYMRLPSTLLKTIRLTAAAHGVTASEFIRDAIKRSLGMRDATAEHSGQPSSLAIVHDCPWAISPLKSTIRLVYAEPKLEVGISVEVR